MPSTLTSTGITFSDGTSQNSAAGGGIIKRKETVYTAGATHTIAAGTEYLEIHAIGGGGGCPKGGGGGAGYAGAIIEKSVSIPNVNSFTINIGAGGGQPLNTGGANAGGATSVGGYIVANGGNQGNDYGNGGNGGTGGTGTVNFSSPIHSATGTGGNGGGGANTSNGSGIRGNPPSNYGGGGGGKGGEGTIGDNAHTQAPFPINRPNYKYDIATRINQAGNNPNTYDLRNTSRDEAPGYGSGGSGMNGTLEGGDGIVMIIEYGSA